MNVDISNCHSSHEMSIHMNVNGQGPNYDILYSVVEKRGNLENAKYAKDF